MAAHFLRGICPLLKEKWTRVNNFPVRYPEILLDKLVIPEYEAVCKLGDIIHITHRDTWLETGGE